MSDRNRTTLINTALLFLGPQLVGFAFIAFVRACIWMTGLSLGEEGACVLVVVAIFIAFCALVPLASFVMERK